MFTAGSLPFQNNGLYAAMSRSQTNVLYLISPRHFDPQIQRPFQMSFSDQYTRLVNDTFTARGGNFSQPDIDRLAQTAIQQSTIVPTMQSPTVIRTDQLSYYWTFIMVVYDDHYNGVAATGNQSRQTIMTGYFVEEPVNPMSLGHTTPTINPNAYMVVTHKVVSQQYQRYNGYGAKSQINRVIDVDVANAQVSNVLGTGHTIIQTPSSLFSMAEFDHDNGSTYTTLTREHALENQVTATAVQKAIYDPAKLAGSMLKSIGIAKEQEQSNDVLGGSILNDSAYPMLVQSNFETASFHNNWTGKLRENDPVQLSSVIAMFNPEIQPIQTQRTSLVGFASQADQTVESIYGSLLMNILPELLSRAALTRMAFRYTSDTGVNSFTSDAMDSYQFDAIDPILPMESSDLHKNAMSILTYLKQTIFSQMIATTGHFLIMVDVTTLDTSNIQIKFFDHDLTYSQPFVAPTIYGGLISPTLANADLAESNAYSLRTFVNDTHAVELPNSPTLHDATYQFPTNTMSAFGGNNTGMSAFSQPTPQASAFNIKF